MCRSLLFQKVYGRQGCQRCASNLKFMAEYVDGLPGRKNLLWMSTNFPIPVARRWWGRAPSPWHHRTRIGQVGIGGGPSRWTSPIFCSDTISNTYAHDCAPRLLFYPINLKRRSGQ